MANRVIGTMMIGAAALLVLTALASGDAPKILTPSDGQSAGPSIRVQGIAHGATLVNVWTEVRDASSGDVIGEVPGLRDFVLADGEFSVRIAEPRIYFGTDTPLRFDIHVKSYQGREELGESMVSLDKAQLKLPDTCQPGGGQAPVAMAPTPDQCVGPNVDVTGRAKPNALVTVWTDVYDAQSGDLLRSVPGLRDRADADGIFHVRIAQPRMIAGRDSPIRYEIHARTESGGNCTPELIVAQKWDKDTCSLHLTMRPQQ